MSEAYLTALTELRERLRRGELHADDLVFTVDADGQHDLQVLDELVEMTIDEGLDANIARRDLSYHGPFKRTGNWVLSKWALGGCAAARRRVGLSHLPPRRARPRARLLLGLPVQRDRRGRGRALPARLQRPQRPRRAGAGGAVTYPHARRVDRSERDPDRRRSGLAPRPHPRGARNRCRRPRRDRRHPRAALLAHVRARHRHDADADSRRDRGVRARLVHPPVRAPAVPRVLGALPRPRRRVAGAATARHGQRNCSRRAVRRRRVARRAAGPAAPSARPRGRGRGVRDHPYRRHARDAARPRRDRRRDRGLRGALRALRHAERAPDAHGCRREHAPDRDVGHRRVLRREHRRRNVVRRRRHARPAYRRHRRPHIRRRSECGGDSRRS